MVERFTIDLEYESIHGQAHYGAHVERKNKTMKAFITGGGRGIGKAIVHVFNGRGYEVCAPTRKELDLSNAYFVSEYIKKHEDDQYDILVNNAATTTIDSVGNVDLPEHLAIYQTNVASAMMLTKWIVRGMIGNSYGRIVNICSVHGILPKAKRISYSMSKAALISLTKNTALEFAEHGILANAVCPGAVETGRIESQHDKEHVNKLRASIPLKQWAQPFEVAKLVDFLCSEHNSHITGQEIVIDGGFTLV